MHRQTHNRRGRHAEFTEEVSIYPEVRSLVASLAFSSLIVATLVTGLRYEQARGHWIQCGYPASSAWLLPVEYGSPSGDECFHLEYDRQERIKKGSLV